MCGEQGHSLKQFSNSKAGDGEGDGKGKGVAGAGSQGECAGASGPLARATGQPSSTAGPRTVRGRAVFVTDRNDRGSIGRTIGAPAPGDATISVASSPFAVPLSEFNYLGASPGPSVLGQTTNPRSLGSKLCWGSQDPVTTWRSETATTDYLQVAGGQSSLSVDVTGPGSGGLGILRTFVVPDSGADVSSIPETA